jgi:DNA-binding CsgD family transcriptional regulator
MLNQWSHRIGDTISALHHADNAQAVWKTVEGAFAAIGFPWICYVGPTFSGGASLPHLMSNVPTDVAERWYSEKLYSFDPSVLRANRSTETFLSGAEFLSADSTHAAILRFYSDLRDIGSRSAFVIPLWSFGQSAPGFVEIGSNHTADQFHALLRVVGREALLVAQFAKEAMIFHQTPFQGSDVCLTAREKECLKWLAVGLRNERIAEVIGIAPATVKLHLFNARRKLGAATREAAVARAVSARLISL